MTHIALFDENVRQGSRLPSRGKRSAVAVVNDSPVDCQSRDRAARRRLSAKLTEGWKVGYWGVPIISNISRAFSAHPSDPAAPGHLPSKGRLGVLRHSESDSPDYNFTQRKRPGAQIAIHIRPKLPGSTATLPEQVPVSILFQMLFYFLIAPLSSTIVQ